MKKTAAAIVALLMTAVICYGVEPLSIQQMLQNSPKETAPQGSTRVLTVRDGTIRQMSYSSVHPVATSTTPGAVKPDGTTTTVDGDGTMHAATVYPNPGIPYSLGNGYGVSFNPDSRIPANYVDLPPLPQSVGPLPAGFHFNSYDATTGVLGYSADASAGSSTDYNAVHTSSAGEIAGVAAKATPAGADLLLIEDSAAGNVKKRIRADSLPFQPPGSYLTTSAIDNTVQRHSTALDAVSGTNTGDETPGSIKTKLGAAGPGDGYMTAAQYVALSTALQPSSTLDATKLSGTAAVNTTGNAATATKLATPRTINGQNFDGSANITITATDSTARVAQTQTINGVAYGSGNITINAVDATPRLATTAQAADSAKLATVTPSANALTLIGHTFSQMVTDLSSALNAAYHGLTILGSEITAALGFTPENVANKSNDGTMAANSSTLYPTQAAVRTYVANNGGGGGASVFRVYSSGSWQDNSTGKVWYRGTGDPDPTSSMGPYDILNDATATETAADVYGLWSGTKDATHCLAGDGTMVACASAPGGVSSVALTVPSFLSVSGSPVTSSGTFAVTLNPANYIPTTGDKSFWDGKQATLTSGTNIKTVGGTTVMGGGDVFDGGPLGTSYGGTGVTDLSFSGSVHKVASVGYTNPASNKCVEVDNTGKLVIAGSNAVCGSGGTGLSTSLASGQIYVGNAGGTATAVSVSGDAVLSNTGALTVTKSGGTPFGSNAFNSTTISALSSTAPVMDGSAAVGVGTTAARSDHVHPSDTSRAAVGQTMYIGTTAHAINRTTGAEALTGITSIDGSAAKWTTARNLAGNSTDGSANVPFANKFIVQGTTDTGLTGAQFLGALGTGLVKNTTTTGVLSIAANSDVLGLWTGTKTSAYCMAGDGTMQSCGGGGGLPTTGGTLTGAVVSSYNGTASTPALSFTGSPYAAGTATTNKPELLLEDTGNTSTGWSTAGTYLGINAKSTFLGNLLDMQLNGASKFKVDYGGGLTATGNLYTSGGAIGGKNGWLDGQNIYFNSTSYGRLVLPGATATGFVVNDKTDTNTSGATYAVKITPTYNQASGTAANTDLLIKRTETAVGSGTQRLLSAGVDTGSYVEKFGIDNTGTVQTGTVPVARVSGLAASATTDTTNANNLSSGTVAAARLPNLINVAIEHQDPQIDGGKYKMNVSTQATTTTVTTDLSVYDHVELTMNPSTGSQTFTLAWSNGNGGSNLIRYATVHLANTGSQTATITWPTTTWIGGTAAATTLAAGKASDYACEFFSTTNRCAIIGEAY